MLRYSFVGWLGHEFGRRVVVLFQKELKGWSTNIISIYIGLVAVGAAWGMWKYFKGRHR